MISPPIPRDEAERLADLRALRILDTPPEERFDQIVRLASTIFSVPIAYIALVDFERQWFKAKCGLQADQTDRSISFCGFTILQDEPLIVEDALLDERFADNPLVTADPHIRFYAGFPLRGPKGHNVATLCLADRKPRPLESHQQDIFRALAELSEQQINMVGLIETQHVLLQTQSALIQTREALAQELAQAAGYVESLLPSRLQGEVRTDWKFVSSSELGGDVFGHHWLSTGKLAFYLLDVCGHGVGAALLSISAFNDLRRQNLPDTDFEDPVHVLTNLNRAFPMSAHGGKYFTGLYGVIDLTNRSISIANAGHPPALFFPGNRIPARVAHASGLPIGMAEATTYRAESIPVEPGNRMYLFSDGAYEVPTKDGMLDYDGFSRLVAGIAPTATSRVDEVYKQVLKRCNSERLDDDFSILELVFS